MDCQFQLLNDHSIVHLLCSMSPPSNQPVLRRVKDNTGPKTISRSKSDHFALNFQRNRHVIMLDTVLVRRAQWLMRSILNPFHTSC